MTPACMREGGSLPLVFYRCARCKREFKTLDAASECEASLTTVKRARAKQYTIGLYPFTITVTVSDGEQKTYVLEDMAHTLR